MSYCSDCDRVPVDYEGGLCGYCKSIRDANDKPARGWNLFSWIVAVGAAWLVVGLALIAKHRV